MDSFKIPDSHAPQPPTQAEYWKGQAKLFRRAAQSQGSQARICETNGANDEALICRVLNCAFVDIAERYEARAKPKEGEE